MLDFCEDMVERRALERVVLGEGEPAMFLM